VSGFKAACILLAWAIKIAPRSGGKQYQSNQKAASDAEALLDVLRRSEATPKKERPAYKERNLVEKITA
jgi:hypothetical protein